MTQPVPSPLRHGWYIVLLLTLLFAVSLVDRFILALLAAPLSRELGLTYIQLSLLIGTGFRRPYEGPAIGLLLAALCGLPIFSLATTMADHRLLLLLGVGAQLSWLPPDRSYRRCASRRRERRRRGHLRFHRDEGRIGPLNRLLDPPASVQRMDAGQRQRLLE